MNAMNTMNVRTAIAGREYTLSWDDFAARFLNRTSLDSVEVLDVRAPKDSEITRSVTIGNRALQLNASGAY